MALKVVCFKKEKPTKETGPINIQHMPTPCQVAFPGTQTHITFTRSFRVGVVSLSEFYKGGKRVTWLAGVHPRSLKQEVIECRFMPVLVGLHHMLCEYK